MYIAADINKPIGMIIIIVTINKPIGTISKAYGTVNLNYFSKSIEMVINLLP